MRPALRKAGRVLGVHFGTTFWSRFGLRCEIPKNFWYFLAQNFVAHLSGWVRLKHGAMAWAFFAPELEKWVSSWDGREIVLKKSKNKSSQMKFSIVEIVPTSDDDVFRLSPVSQRPSGAKIKQSVNSLLFGKME